MRLALSRHVVVALIAVLAVSAAACGDGQESSAPPPRAAEVPVSDIEADPAIEVDVASPDESPDEEPEPVDEPALVSEADIPDDLAYVDTPARVAPAIDDAVCVAVVPSDPAADAVGVVTYRLVDDWAPWQYLALWVPNADGNSALTAGEPSVRNGDSFEFRIDDSMTSDSDWVIDTVTPDGSMLPCAIRTVKGTTAAGLAGNGTAGY